MQEGFVGRVCRRRTRYDILEPPPVVNEAPEPSMDTEYSVDFLMAGLEDDLADLLPNDTEAALQILRSQCTYEPPILLKNHLYYLIEDRTTLDRELMELQCKGQLHEFKLPFSPETYYVFVDDLRVAFQNCKKEYYQKQEAKKQKAAEHAQKKKEEAEASFVKGPPAIAHGMYSVPFRPPASTQSQRSSRRKPVDDDPTLIFDLFAERVVSVYLGTTISLDTLLSLMFPHIAYQKGYDDIVLLVECGALTLLGEGKARHQGYQLGCPGLGSLYNQITNGRKEIIQKIKRNRYKEEALSILENIKLKKSSFPPAFHLKDLLGGNFVERYDTASGIIVRLPSSRV